MLLLAKAKLHKIGFFFHGQEKRCRILERHFWLFQCSRNLECPDDYYPIFVDGLSAANLDHFGGPIYLGNMILKFVFSKKATKLTKSSLLIWHLLHNVKSTVKISSSWKTWTLTKCQKCCFNLKIFLYLFKILHI